MSFYAGSWVKRTRKRHVCDWCGKFIEIGAAARYAAGVHEGDFWHGYEHPECAAAWDSLPWRVRADGYNRWEYARGRTDDDGSQPPQFSEHYRGEGNPPANIPAPSAAAPGELSPNQPTTQP